MNRATIILGFLIAAAPVHAGEYEGPKEKLHVYLLMGQSNMAGRAPFTKEEAGVIPRCWLLNDEGKWEGAKNPLNRYSTIRKGLGMQKMSPGYTFAKTMLEREKTVNIGLVVNAQGGTSIEQWAKGTEFYEEALKRTRIALETGTLKGILWHQGESDSDDKQYLEKLEQLIADLREDLGDPKLPFVAGQINRVKLINDQIAALPAKVPFTGFASSEGLEAMDRWHFDSRSMRILGQKYAAAMIEVQASLKGQTKQEKK